MLGIWLGLAVVALVPLWSIIAVIGKLHRQSRLVLVGVWGLMVFALVVGYLWFGAYEPLAQYAYWVSHPEKKEVLLHTLTHPESLVALLEHQVQIHPEDQQAKELLLNSYLRTHRYEQAYHLAQANTLPLLPTLEAYFWSGHWNPQEEKNLQDYLFKYPDSTSAMQLLAVVYAKNGDWHHALHLWRKLSGLLKPESPAWRANNAAIDHALEEIQALSSLPAH